MGHIHQPRHIIHSVPKVQKEVLCSNFLRNKIFSFGGKFIKTQDILRDSETSNSVGKLGKTQEVYNSITSGSSYS